jgi:hypothetical protein
MANAKKAAKKSTAPRRAAKRSGARQPQYVVYAPTAKSTRISDEAIDAAVRAVVKG